jgi:heat shock protein HslJ
VVQVSLGRTAAVESFIEINEPKQGAVVDIANPVTVSGQGGGLPEGNVVVQALDRDGTVLAEQATIVDAPDAGTGGQGPWSVGLNIDVEPGRPGQIYAFSPSPADNSLLAEARLNVLFGEPAEDVPPTAVINGPGQALTGEEVSFDGRGSEPGNGGNLVRYDWDFGDGATASGPVAEHTYNEAGSYNVTLIVTDEAGQSSSSTARVEVSEPEEPTPEPTEEPGDLPLEGQTWTLAGTPEGVTITLVLENGAVSGSAGCNTYSGSYTANNGQITISGLSAGRQVCEDDVMAAEAAYLQALPTATAYQVNGDSMTLTTAGGSLNCVSGVSAF